MHNIAIGRQPIYDNDLQVVAYELLFRSNSQENQANFLDGDRATTEVIINAFTEIGLPKLVSNMPAYLNLTQSFISGDYPLPNIAKKVVLEVLEHIPVTDTLISELKLLREQGYTIALDDFIYQQNLDALVDAADIIKLDLMEQSQEELKKAAGQLRQRGKKLLAEKVETHEEFTFCKTIGFDYYQGYFFCKPEIVTGQSIPANKLQILQLLAKLHDNDIHVDELVTDISSDLTLSYRLLRYINSVQFGMRQEIESIKQAVMLLGWNNIRSISTLMVLSSIEDKPFELIKTGLVRARMCEQLSKLQHADKTETLYTIGLLSIIDAVLDCTIDDAVSQLPLTQNTKDALVHKSGGMGELLNSVINYVRGDLEAFTNSRIDTSLVMETYLAALQWADAAALEIEH